MTDTIDAPALPPEPPAPRRNPTTIVLAVIAAVAVIALAIVAFVAVTNDDDTHTTMMGNHTTPNSMMGRDDMMGGSAMGGAMMGHGASNPTVPGAREIAISATSFRFDPAEIHVRASEDVTIVLAASDVGHDFTIEALDFHVAATAGQVGRGGLHAPNAAGRYTAYCSVAGHRQAAMTATVVVDAS